MPKNNRVSMKGMGADAFFGPERDQPAATPGSQETSAPGNQQDSTPVQQQNRIPGSQDTRKHVDQQDSEPFIKATYYITSELDMILETIRLKRKQRGMKVDKSALVREAIRLLQAEGEAHSGIGPPG